MWIGYTEHWFSLSILNHHLLLSLRKTPKTRITTAVSRLVENASYCKYIYQPMMKITSLVHALIELCVVSPDLRIMPRKFLPIITTLMKAKTLKICSQKWPFKPDYTILEVSDLTCGKIQTLNTNVQKFWSNSWQKNRSIKCIILIYLTLMKLNKSHFVSICLFVFYYGWIQPRDKYQTCASFFKDF